MLLSISKKNHWYNFEKLWVLTMKMCENMIFDVKLSKKILFILRRKKTKNVNFNIRKA